MYITFSRIWLRVQRVAALALVWGSLAPVAAQSPEDASPISSTLSDSQLIEYSAEPRFAAAALPIVQTRICIYAEAAKTSHGQAFISELHIPRAVVPPASLCLTNAISAAQLYLDFKAPPELTAGEAGAAWTELGLAVLDRVNAVLHHYYLAVEYRRGHVAALTQLRDSARRLAAYLGKRAGTAETLAETKARYAALWFEKCDDVIPVYRGLIGTGASGAVREILVLRPADLPLVTAWDWEERKHAGTVQKQFIQELSSSTNPVVRVEGLFLGLARTRTDRAYVNAFTNVVEAIENVGNEGTRTAYKNLIKELLDDRHSKDLSEKTRSELRRMYDVRYVAASAPGSTNAVTSTNASTEITVAQADAVSRETNAGSSRPAPKSTTVPQPEKRTPIPTPVQKKAAPSWQLLLADADIRYWETMPLPELRSMAASGDVVANYYIFLKIRNSDSSNLQKEAVSGLEYAFKAGFPQAELAYANRISDAEERFHWTKKAASTGYPAAQLDLGKLYVLGHGTPMDMERGLSLVRASYDLKVPEAEAVLGELYASGVGDPRNLQERAENLLIAAARNNQRSAMLELHYRYLEGYGVTRDHLEACRWLVNVGIHDKSALSKYLDESGKSIAQPTTDLDRFAKTLAVYAQAIILKQPEAITHVADWYATGSIGRKSSLRAYALLSLASESPKVTPETLQKAKAALTPQQLKTAEILASQWQRIQPDLL